MLGHRRLSAKYFKLYIHLVWIISNQEEDHLKNSN